MRRRKSDDRPGLVASFEHLDSLIGAVKKAKEDELEIMDVFSPVPVEAVRDLLSPSKSPVRFWTFLGGLSGIVGGFALCILTAVIWNIIVGGKPVTDWIPFVVVAFESLILLGALFTFNAILFSGRLPFVKFPGPAYRPEFSLDRFGLWISCAEEHKASVRKFLESAGAQSVFDVEPVAKGSVR